MTDLAGLNIKYLPGVGPKRAELLNKELEIFTYLDLLHYYPLLTNTIPVSEPIRLEPR